MGSVSAGEGVTKNQRPSCWSPEITRVSVLRTGCVVVLIVVFACLAYMKPGEQIGGFACLSLHPDRSKDRAAKKEARF